MLPTQGRQFGCGIKFVGYGKRRSQPSINCDNDEPVKAQVVPVDWPLEFVGVESRLQGLEIVLTSIGESYDSFARYAVEIAG